MRFHNFLYNKKFKHEGQVYDLSHLKPIVVNVKARAGVVPVRITISTHVFTEAFDESRHEISLKIEDHTSESPNWYHDRAFNKFRYKKSLTLPRILKAISHRTTIRKADNGDFMVSDDNYYVFFRIYRKGNTARLHVKSAYIKTNGLSGKKSTIGKRLVEKGF